jgi:hypothetical protein
VKRTCMCCGCRFVPRANVPDQQYCSRRTCQNARRQRWRKQKLKSDADYRADQYASQERWCEKNPDYWQRYRSTHPDYCQKNREMQTARNRKRDLIRERTAGSIAKRYALTGENRVIPGYYNLVPADGAVIAKRYALLVKLDVVSGNYISGP